ncbi:MAG: glycosyltransferase [Lacibacter sp.]
MQADIAIVIAAFNRPASLQRVLNSIAVANFNDYQRIQLIISIDYSGSDECKKIAGSFYWQHGEKKILAQEQNLGLKKHILLCGDLVSQFDAVIVLEDDLFVSAHFYDYAQQAYTFYKDEERIAGIALYHNTFNEIAYCPFEPVHDGSDNYFMQVPCSWGQLWTKKQWSGFVSYASGIKDEQEFDALPANVQQWPTISSWKKIFYSYLFETGKYFLYPRVGLSTNFGDAGQHLDHQQTVFQTALLLSKKRFHFKTLDDSLSIYDGFFEPDGSLYNKLVDATISVSFDLNGTKPLSSIKTSHLISSKQCIKPIKKFAVSCYPYENNVFLNIEEITKSESYFSLAATTTFSEQQQFCRLPLDLKRIFLRDGFLRDAVRNELEQTKEFHLGNALLTPLRLMMNLLKKFK